MEQKRIISPDSQVSTLSRDQCVVIHCLVSTTGVLSASPLAGVMVQWPGARHCESGEEVWLQREAGLQVQSFRDTDPQPVILPNEKKNHGISASQLRPGMNISLTSTEPCLPSTA